jgi:hypothetical protein
MNIDRDVAVIVCAGPSLDALPPRAWDDVAHAGAIVAVNGACAASACARQGVRFTLLAAMDLSHGLDERVPRLAEVWKTTPAWRVTSVDAADVEAESYLVEVDEEDGVDGWSDHPDEGYKGGSTGMIVGNWIANPWPDDTTSIRERRAVASSRGKTIHPRGFRKLAYLGLDMRPLDGRHADGAGIHASGFSDSVEHHRRVCDGWGKFCTEAARRGVEVVNLTPGTGLETMPRVALPHWSLVA